MPPRRASSQAASPDPTRTRRVLVAERKSLDNRLRFAVAARDAAAARVEAIIAELLLLDAALAALDGEAVA